MSNKRANVKKLLKCNTCNKADYKSIIPGALTFFDRCTFTMGCNGRLTVDPNVIVTPRNEQTWTQIPVVHKTTFKSKRIVTVPHNFGQIGSVVVEVFVEVSTGISSLTTKIKTTDFTIVEQTANTIVVDLITSRTGTVVVTDNQYNVSSRLLSTPLWQPPNLLTNNIITIAADIDAIDFECTLVYKPITSTLPIRTAITFLSHYQNPTPVGRTLWAQFKVLATEKPYYIYSAEIPNSAQVMQKGTLLQLDKQTAEDVVTATPPLFPTIVWPMAVADKSAISDIVTSRLIRNSTVRLGDLMFDNNRLVVANSAIIEDLNKPFVIY